MTPEQFAETSGHIPDPRYKWRSVVMARAGLSDHIALPHLGHVRPLITDGNLAWVIICATGEYLEVHLSNVIPFEFVISLDDEQAVIEPKQKPKSKWLKQLLLESD